MEANQPLRARIQLASDLGSVAQPLDDQEMRVALDHACFVDDAVLELCDPLVHLAKQSLVPCPPQLLTLQDPPIFFDGGVSDKPRVDKPRS
jgi:hypothetical protein